jgi:outer membrane lipoprotein carrier protein
MRLRVAAIASLVLSWWTPGGLEAAPAHAPIEGKERIEIIERLQEQQREIASLRATVVQKKRHPLLATEVVSEGTLLFQKPNRVRWEVGKPDRVVIVIDGRTLVTYRPDRQEAERRDLGSDFGARAAVEFLTSGMSLAVPELEKRFQVDMHREDGLLVLVLTPRSRWAAKAVASVALYRQDRDAVPSRIVISGQPGDRTEITLTDIVINPPVAEDAFTLRLGPGVRVTDLSRPGGEKGSDR